MALRRKRIAVPATIRQKRNIQIRSQHRSGQYGNHRGFSSAGKNAAVLVKNDEKKTKTKRQDLTNRYGSHREFWAVWRTQL